MMCMQNNVYAKMCVSITNCKDLQTFGSVWYAPYCFALSLCSQPTHIAQQLPECIHRSITLRHDCS